MEPLQKLKRVTLETFLAYGATAMVFDSHVMGLTIPPELENQGEVVFHLGYNLPVPIPDLELTDAGVSATLSFDQTPFKVLVPWEAVTHIGLFNTSCVCHYNRTESELIAGADEESEEAPEPAPPSEPAPDAPGKVIPFKVLDGGVK